MRYYDYENALIMWLQNYEIGRASWNIDEVSLETFWENLDEEDEVADDYIIYAEEENELEYLKDKNEELKNEIYFLEEHIKMLNKYIDKLIEKKE
jgi:hypothetical protein